MRGLAAALLLSLAACASAPSPAGLAAAVEGVALEAERSGTGADGSPHRIAVAFLDLETGAEYFRNERLVLHAASTMKVPVMLALFEAAGRGEIRFDQPVPVRNEFRSMLDGTPFQLDPAEDGDPELYQAVGETRPLDELTRRMIVRSSNLATNLLVEYATPKRITDLMTRLGAPDVRVLRGVEDEKAWAAGLNNTTTARDLALVMRAIADRTAVSAEASDRMLAILRAQEFREKIPAGIPEGAAVVANKTGEITRISHDAAIVSIPGRRPYVLVVLTSGFDRGSEAEAAIAAISRAVWAHRGR